MTHQEYHPQAILRLRQVKLRTGLSKSSIYLAIQQGVFPRQINIGKRAVGWLECDIDAWVKERISQRAQAQTEGE